MPKYNLKRLIEVAKPPREEDFRQAEYRRAQKEELKAEAKRKLKKK